jgi:hypothetical protein
MDFFFKIDLYVHSKIVWSQDDVLILVCFESMVFVVCGENLKCKGEVCNIVCTQ